MKLALGIHHIGDQSIVNAYLLEDAGEVTIIDAGVPGYYRDIPRELAAMGRTVADVRALLLTHGHTDHIGFAERLRREHHVPVSVHATDAALPAARYPTRPRGTARSSSARCWGSCGSRSGGVGCGFRSCTRSRRSAMERPLTCRAVRGSS